jgi:hypothetical protein
MLRQVADNGLDFVPPCSSQVAVVLVVGYRAGRRECPVLSVYIDAEMIPVPGQVSPKAPEGASADYSAVASLGGHYGVYGC